MYSSAPNFSLFSKKKMYNKCLTTFFHLPSSLTVRGNIFCLLTIWTYIEVVWPWPLYLTFVVFILLLYFRISYMSLYFHHLDPSFAPSGSFYIPHSLSKSRLLPLYSLLLRIYNILSPNVACLYTCLGLITWDWIACQEVYLWRKLNLFLGNL